MFPARRIRFSHHFAQGLCGNPALLASPGAPHAAGCGLDSGGQPWRRRGPGDGGSAARQFCDRRRIAGIRARVGVGIWSRERRISGKSGSMLTVLRVHLPSEIPVVGCEITPYVLLRRPDGNVATDDVPESAPINGCYMRYKW